MTTFIPRNKMKIGASGEYEIRPDHNVNGMIMVFSRPTSIPYPTVWHRFTARDIELRIQDLTDDMFDPALKLLSKYFTRDEPPCKYIGVQNYPVAKSELEKLWLKTVLDRVSLVCIEESDDQPPKIVGVNVLTVACKDDKDEPFQSDDPAWAALFGAVDFVARSVNIFEHYGVDKFLNAYGLVVDPQWRGFNIGKEMLKTRIPLCKALDIKVTATVFTAGASQTVAKRAGFETLYEIPYEELAKKGFVFPGISEDTKCSKLMAMRVE